MAIEGTYFFRPPLNQDRTPKVFTDNRYDKSLTVGTTQTTINVDVDGDGTGTAQEFTHIFLKAKGTIPSALAFSPTGGTAGGETVTLDADVLEIAGGTVRRSRTVKGFYNLLHEYSNSAVTAQQIGVSAVTGTIDIVQLLILRAEVNIAQDGFSDIRWKQRLPGLEQESARGRGSVSPPVAGNRDKHDLILTAHKNTNDDISRALDAFFSEYPEFVFATEPNRFPEQVFYAKNLGQTAEYEYVSQYKGRGRRAVFTISEL